MTLNECTFNFKENLDNIDEDDQLKLPDDIFNKFSHDRDRRDSEDSDDMVKYDNDTRFDFSPQKVIQDFESTDYVLKKKSRNNI